MIVYLHIAQCTGYYMIFSYHVPLTHCVTLNPRSVPLHLGVPAAKYRVPLFYLQRACFGVRGAAVTDALRSALGKAVQVDIRLTLG